MDVLKITKKQACAFLLAYHGLGSVQPFKGKQGVLDYIKHVGCIQYDTLNIVGRNPELVLQSRISDFRPWMLEELLYKDRKLVDGLDKVMSIYCIEDWPYFRRFREAALKRYGNKTQPIAPFLLQIREALKERGPLSSIDLDLHEMVDWSWVPTRVSRAALESMYFWGELIIHHKVNTRKVYDFAERYISKELLEAAEPNVTKEQYFDWRVLRRIRAMGLLWCKSGDAWIGTLDIKSKERNEAFVRLLKQEKIIEVEVEDIKYPLYINVEALALMNTILGGDTQKLRASIIAPLDNILWDRKLVKELFAFDYKWEVYKPTNERNYGYYVLPVLYGDHFVARFEPIKNKKNGALVIKNWWWEPGVKQTKKMYHELQQCLKRFAGYLGTDMIQIDAEINLQGELDWLTGTINNKL